MSIDNSEIKVLKIFKKFLKRTWGTNGKSSYVKLFTDIHNVNLQHGTDFKVVIHPTNSYGCTQVTITYGKDYRPVVSEILIAM